MAENATAILLISCPDKRGITARVTEFIYRHNGSIEHADQHVDREHGIFFMRVEWTLEGFDIPRDGIPSEFSGLADDMDMEWELYFSDQRPRTAIFVSRRLHCLYDILYRYREGRLNADIPLIISNHPDAEKAAATFSVEFRHIPVNADGRKEAEKQQLELLLSENIELVVLARYMQILSGEFTSSYPNRIINIHHSFLPAFAGADPYQQAHDRGVKIIGATSHYVTEELDAGPIIEQDVVRISHRNSVEDLRMKGEDLEKIVLSRALRLHLERRILCYCTEAGSKTVIFD